MTIKLCDTDAFSGRVKNSSSNFFQEISFPEVDRIQINFGCNPIPSSNRHQEEIEDFNDSEQNNIDDYSDLTIPSIINIKADSISTQLQLNSKLISFLNSTFNYKKKGKSVSQEDNHRQRSSTTIQRKSSIPKRTNKEFNQEMFFKNQQPYYTDSLKKPYVIENDKEIFKHDMPKEITKPIKNNWFKLFTNNHMQDFLPVSFVPYLTIKELKNQNINLDLSSIESMECLLDRNSSFLNYEIHEKKSFNISYGDRAYEIPFSDVKASKEVSTKNSFGAPQVGLTNFYFFSQDLFPINPTNTNIDELLKITEIDDKSTVNEKLKALFENGTKPKLSSDLYPFASNSFFNIPIYSGNLKIKGKKLTFCQSYLNASGLLICGSYNCQISNDIVAVGIDTTSFKLCKDNTILNVFYTENNTSLISWVNQINYFASSRSTNLFNLYLFMISSTSPSITIESQMIECIISPFLLFSVSLLNSNKIGLTKANMMFNILLSNGKLDFFIRSILSAEISLVPFSKLFTVKTRYTVSLLTLFCAVGSEWLNTLVSNINYNYIENGFDLLTIIYSLFSLIDKKSLYILRSILLMLLTICPSGLNPLVQFFRFIKISLRPFYEISFSSVGCEYQYEKAFEDLENLILLSKGTQNNRLILELAPFTRKIINQIPHLEGYKEITEIQARELYLFMLQNIDYFLEDFKSFHNIEISKLPIAFSFYQNFKFLLKEHINSNKK